jgi:hypothetical protein
VFHPVDEYLVGHHHHERADIDDNHSPDRPCVDIDVGAHRRPVHGS